MSATDSNNVPTSASATESVRPAGKVIAPAGPNAPTSRPLSTAEGIRLVAGREIVSTLRTKSFIWSFLITALMIAALILGQRFIGDFFAGAMGFNESVRVAATQDIGSFNVSGFETQQVSSADEAVELLRNDEVDAVWLTSAEAASLDLVNADGNPANLPDNPMGVVVGKSEVPRSALEMLTVSPSAAQLEYEGGVNPGLAYGLTIGFGVLFFMSVMAFSMRIAQTVVEEKASRIVELLLSSLPPRTILAGKIIGGTILAMGQTFGLLAVALICFAIVGDGIPLDQIGTAAIWFFVLFFFGFVVFAALYGGMGATVSRPEEVADATMPLMMLAMAPYMLVIFFATNAPFMKVLSYIPFSAPVAMPIRIFRGEAEWWEPIVTLAILIVSAVLAIALGSRLYERSVLRTQGKVKLSEALRG